MRFKKGMRSFTPKINVLILRPEFRDDYPHEFLNRMTDKEIDVFFAQVRKLLKDEGFPVSKNINQYNLMFRRIVEERNDIFQKFMEYDSIPVKA